MTPSPVPPSTPVPAAQPSELQKIAQDLLMFGLLAGSILIKNPNTQTKAGSIATILEELIPFL
jgi:hypothetical protein